MFGAILASIDQAKGFFSVYYPGGAGGCGRTAPTPKDISMIALDSADLAKGLCNVHLSRFSRTNSPTTAIDEILRHLPGPVRFRQATLLRIEPHDLYARLCLHAKRLSPRSCRSSELPLALGDRAKRIHRGAISYSGFSALLKSIRRLGLHQNAFHLAAQNGHTAVLDWWMDRWPRPGETDSNFATVQNVLHPAFLGDHVNVLGWCRRHKPGCFSTIEKWALEAAEANRAEALEWLDKEADLEADRLRMLDYTDDTLQLAHLRKREAADEAPVHNVNSSLEPSSQSASNNGGAPGFWIGSKQADMSDRFVCPLTIASVKEELYDWWRPNRHALTYDGGEYVGEFITRKASNREIMEWLAEMLDRAVSDRFGVPADLERPWLDLITVPTNWLQTRGREEALDSLKWWRARGAERGDIPENFNTKRVCGKI
ncbi:hypothetical protein DFJ73DRAFT_758154 [Zopfochytrium polystomum]|nr:hypothetical protein DFJ73DRAFT_758154 [Zopfochytrium polystomum]